MPVILRREDEDRWMDPGLKDPEALRAMLQPYPSEEM
jgi:putative SOS response-associated peptidase YedK